MAALFVTPNLTIPDDELSVAFARSAGPGGQNVNKVETQVELRWALSSSRALSDADKAWLLSRLASRLTNGGELLVTSSLTRSQLQNRQDATEKLVNILRVALVRPKRRRKTRPTRGSVERRLTEKKQRSDRKRSRSGNLD
ncbi:MAG: alternative ribosome rescue aminoacyl-tRNA hydrolase ArfB [Deltaproteobacteria bacterium]|nr:alternative ribosome rescue aminoacyl-tRNA hydrolase ArfB [Deltaproteobacteria bacterium]